jgi:hypothetical protein
MDNFNREDIIKLLLETGSIVDKYETIARETGGNFNVFEITDISTKETVVCRFLRELLSPTGHHGQKGAYLEIFLRDFLGRDFGRDKADNAKVYLEYPADGRRIDMVIEVGGCFVPIEVKINAGEGTAQCYDYYNFAKGKDENAKVVYLTKYGEPPSEYSAKGLTDGIINLSFARDIISWLERCLTLPETIRKAPIREVIIQFISSIKKFTDQLEDKPLDGIIELLTGSPKNIRNAEIVAGSLNRAKADMVYRLFDAIEKGVGRERLNVVNYDSDDAWSVKTFYNRNKPTYPAISYLFKKLNADINIWFRVEIGYEFLYAGLCLTSDNKSVDWKIGADGGERWEYLLSEDERPNFRHHNDCFYNLFDKAYFDSFVTKCVTRIGELWDEYKDKCKGDMYIPT